MYLQWGDPGGAPGSWPDPGCCSHLLSETAKEKLTKLSVAPYPPKNTSRPQQVPTPWPLSCHGPGPWAPGSGNVAF